MEASSLTNKPGSYLSVRGLNFAKIQICLFSATIPTWVRSVANYHMKQNCRVVDLALDLKNKTAKKVQHLAINCPF